MTSSPNFQLPSQLSRWIIIGFSLLFLIRIGIIFELPFTDTTEARYAEIARKMVETNDWITPQFDYGVPFWGKPPLHTWISAAGMKFFGVNAFGARIGIFITALLILISLYLWARRIKGFDYALAGTFIVASGILFLLSAANVMTDLVMVAGTTLCMTSFWDCLHRKNQTKWSSYLFFIGLAIGMLAKGPVAVVLCALPIGLWVLLTNSWAATWKKIPWLSGILLTIAISFPWYYLAEEKTPGFLNYFLVGEHYQRFINSGWDGDLYGHGHAHPKGAIWLYAFATLIPWTPFILWPLIRVKRVIDGFRKEFRSADPKWSLYLLCWALSPLIFFTMAGNILMTYTLSGIPAFGFLALSLWQQYSPNSPSTHSPKGMIPFYKGSSIAAVIIALIALIAISFFPNLLGHRTQKYLIQKANSVQQETANTDSCVYYYPKRYYSAEFYSEGNATHLRTSEELSKLLSNNTRDILAIRKKDEGRLPSGFIHHFTLIETFQKGHQLYLENPLKP